MNDTTCEKEKRKLNEPDAKFLSVDEDENGKEQEIEIRKIELNNKEVELVRFGDISITLGGVMSSDNMKYLGMIENATVSSYSYKVIPDDLIVKDELTEREKGKGIKKQKEVYPYYVPIDKGGVAYDGEKLRNYFDTCNFVIDWSEKSVKSLKENNGLRNHDYYFKKGIVYSEAGIYSPTFKLNTGFVFAKANPCTFLTIENFSYEFLLGILCSKQIRYFFKNFINHSVHVVMSDLEEIYISIFNNNEIEFIVKSIIEKLTKNIDYDYMTIEQKEIDRLVYELYGLNEEDIQEVEYWWTRRYPKLDRFADTKPRLSIKDKQEQLARLQEIITRGENKYCEFKSSLRLNVKKGTTEKYIEHTAFKNIAGFLNSEGGTLIIGVDDGKNILGLENTDYTTFSKPDKQDEWSKHLDNLMQNFIGNKMHHFIQTQFIQTEDSKTIALVEVQPSTEPVWLKNGSVEEFYIRRTASAIQLSGREAMEYINAKWKK